jgi:hypothetical protein
MTTLKKGEVSPGEQNIPENNTPLNKTRIDALKKMINNEDYLYEAIHRIAFVLSNEISGGGAVERKG